MITRPSAGLQIPGRGYVQITGLAWSGGGEVTKVDVSTDGGKTWKEAKLQAPVLTKAHTRFTFDWAWDGEEAVLLSRCTDEQGEVQPSRAELYEHWGITGEEAKKPPAPFISMPCSPGEWPAMGVCTMRCSLNLLVPAMIVLAAPAAGLAQSPSL